jgi:hypothetical protein
MSLQDAYDWDGLAAADIVAVDTETSLPDFTAMTARVLLAWPVPGRVAA